MLRHIFLQSMIPEIQMNDPFTDGGGEDLLGVALGHGGQVGGAHLALLSVQIFFSNPFPID